MFCEFLEAASFIALYAGLRMGLLHVNAQVLLPPIAVAIILAADGTLRGSPFAPSGLRWAGLGTSLWEWKSVVLTVFGVLPAALFLAFRLVWPSFLDYLAEYLGRLRGLRLKSFLPFALAFTFMEEMIARGYLQNRLAAVFGTPAAVVLASAFFAWAHRTPGPRNPHARTHVAIGFLVSIVLGWMYASTRNLFVVWIAHALWDVVLLVLMAYCRGGGALEPSGPPEHGLALEARRGA